MNTQRHLGLFGATGVGVGAIVGGGILALAGVAFSATGPSAIVAFALNGAIAVLTALSFAEMASMFPESGGIYTFSKKVLSVESAFTVGWVVWFASIVAAVLYAIGFAYFGWVLLSELSELAGIAFGHPSPGTRAVNMAAAGATLLIALSLLVRPPGGGHWVNVGKVFVFGLLIVGGLAAMTRRSPGELTAPLQPFFAGGWMGLIQAMGYTFIALQGFDLIAAVGGEIREPERNIPRAMILSLAIALLIYLPLLLVIATVGVGQGENITEVARQNPEEIVAIAAQHFLGRFGYWLVMVAAVLSMFSALYANVYAASRIALTMARDRTLPHWIDSRAGHRRVPYAAVAVTAAFIILIVLIIPNVGAAGAASSLIFLITFALAHWIAVLVRQRSVRHPPPFRVALYPAVPALGGLACLGLAVFQGITVPAAGLIATTWLAVGGLLFLILFARRARLKDALATAMEPELLTLRGKAPLVLVPIANPNNAEPMIALADALVPAHVGRVVMLTVAVAPLDWRSHEDAEPIEQTQAVLGELLKASNRVGIRAEVLTTVAPMPMLEIARVAQLHRCESLLLGLSGLDDASDASALESLLGNIDANVVVLRSRPNWSLAEAQNILVPLAGRGGHEFLLARLLGSLLRGGRRKATLLRVLPPRAGADEVARARRELTQLAVEEIHERCTIEVVRHEAPLDLVAARADQADLVILGIQRIGPRLKLLGHFTRQLAQRTSCPMVVISRRR